MMAGVEETGAEQFDIVIDGLWQAMLCLFWPMSQDLGWTCIIWGDSEIIGDLRRIM